MIIPISKKYRIATDSLQWMLQSPRKQKGKNGKQKTVWVPFAYFGSLQQCIESLGQRLVRQSNAETVAEAIEDIDRITTKLCQALTPQFEVRVNGTDVRSVNGNDKKISVLDVKGEGSE